MTRKGVGVRINGVFLSIDQEGGGLSRVCPASAIIRDRVRVIGPVKLDPCVGASSAGGPVSAPG